MDHCVFGEMKHFRLMGFVAVSTIWLVLTYKKVLFQLTLIFFAMKQAIKYLPKSYCYEGN